MQSRRLFQSDFYEIKRWEINLTPQRGRGEGYNDCFCLLFVHSGRLAVELAAQPYELYTGHVVVEKTDYAYKLRPTSAVCSIFNFSAAFYEQFIEEYGLRHSSFFANPNLLTLSLTTSPAIDYLHHQIVHTLRQASQLEMDCLVIQLVRQVVERVENRPLAELTAPPVKSFRLATIEQAKLYLNSRFNENISLVDLAGHCCVSPFHLSRLFKECTGYSPHQYLLTVRLTHAEQLLRQPALTVADVCYASGFNSPEHFAAAFQHKNHLSATQYRKQ